MRFPKKRLLFLFPFLALSLLGTSGRLTAQGERGFVSLWNGKNFSGWRKVGGGATFHIEGDCIVGEVGPGPNTFLRTEKTFGDFILKVEVKIDIPGNSGIQFRSHQREKTGQVYGYQCEIDPSPRSWTGGIYDEGRRGWLYTLENQPKAQQAFQPTDWNELVIQAIGPSIKTWVNGIPCADLIDTTDLEGFIALQIHSGSQGRIRWRNIRIKDLGQRRWKPLWNGKNFDGWEKIGGGDWEIQNGVLRGVNTQAEPQFGHLITKKEFKNFAIRLKFLAKRGNSGLYFRVQQGGPAGVQGLQADIDPEQNTGGIYDISGRGWLVQPKPEEVKKWQKPNEWNELSLVALGPRIVVHLNGYKTADIKDSLSRPKGSIALQLHGGQEVEVFFKEIEILLLPSEGIEEGEADAKL